MPIQITGGEQVAPGTYTAILERIEEGTGTFGAQRKWHWLLDVNGEFASISSLTSMNTGPQSKAFAYLTALLGAPPKAGETIEEPVGKRLTVTVDHNEKGFARIAAVAPFVEPQQTLPGVPR